jgi:ATP-dependent Lon protease
MQYCIVTLNDALAKNSCHLLIIFIHCFLFIDLMTTPTQTHDTEINPTVTATDTNTPADVKKDTVVEPFNLMGLPDDVLVLITDLQGNEDEIWVMNKHRSLMTQLPPSYRHMILCHCLPNFSSFDYQISRLQCLSLMLYGCEHHVDVINQTGAFMGPHQPLEQSEVDFRFSLIQYFLGTSKIDSFRLDYYENLFALILHGMSIKQINASSKLLSAEYLLYTLLLNSKFHPLLAIFEKLGLDVRHINGENSLLALLDKYHTHCINLQAALDYLVHLDLSLVEENSRFYTFFDYVFFSWIATCMSYSNSPVFMCSHGFFHITRKRFYAKREEDQNSPWPSRVVAGENILFKIRNYKYHFQHEFKSHITTASDYIHTELKNTTLQTDLINMSMQYVFEQASENILLWFLIQHVNTGSHIKQGNNVPLFDILKSVSEKADKNKDDFYDDLFTFFFDFCQWCFNTLKVRELGPVKITRELSLFENTFFYYLLENQPFTPEFLNRFEAQFVTKPEEPVVETKTDDEIHAELFSEETQKKFETYVTNVGNGNSSSFENSKAFVRRLKTEKNIRHKTFAKSSMLLNKIEQLYQDFPHFKEVIEHIENHCVLQNQGNGAFYVPPLLLAGGPGIGKTFFCHMISELVDTPMHVFNMESMTGNFAMTGLSEAWGNAAPGMIFNVIVNKHRINPIFIFDELDKAKGDERFSPTNSLLPLLERYTAKSFKDECIQIELDASHSIWVATANTLETLSAPLKSRFDIYNVPNPNWHQRRNLIQGIYHSLLQNNSWGHTLNADLSQTILDVLADAMGPGAARDLRRTITTACAKAARHQRKDITLADLPVFHQANKMPWDTTLNLEQVKSGD